MLLPSIITASIVLLLDQISKMFILKYMTLNEFMHILPILNISIIHNHGMAFGWLSNNNAYFELQRWLFVGIAIFVSFIMFIWGYTFKNKNYCSNTIAIGMIVGGAWGNMLDRIRFGSVTDFLDFYLGHWHWYIFNIADLGICIGVIMILISNFRNKNSLFF